MEPLASLECLLVKDGSTEGGIHVKISGKASICLLSIIKSIEHESREWRRIRRVSRLCTNYDTLCCVEDEVELHPQESGDSWKAVRQGRGDT